MVVESHESSHNHRRDTVTFVSYLCSSVHGQSIAPASQGLGTIPVGGTVIEEFFSTAPGLNFDMCRISSQDL